MQLTNEHKEAIVEAVEHYKEFLKKDLMTVPRNKANEELVGILTRGIDEMQELLEMFKGGQLQ